MLKSKTIYIVAVLLLSLAACKDKKKGEGFDRTAMLTNLGNNIIAPAHQQFATAAATLKLQADTFTNNPTTSTLQSFKAAYVNAYKALMLVETYSFDPSAELRVALNSFPPDTDRINTNATSTPGSYNLNTASNVRAKGFPAIDYLIYGTDETNTLNLFTSVNRQAYLNTIVTEINDKANAANAGWTGYMPTFINANGIDVGSSIGILVNDLAFETERGRRERVGNAIGYVGFINSGIKNPYLVEAGFSTLSKELLIQNLQGLKELYTGGSLQGFDDYLENVNAAIDGQPASTVISSQFDIAIAAAQNVPVSLGTAVTTNNQEMETLFLELKKLVVFVKVDMSSQLGVVINYSDNDGD